MYCISVLSVPVDHLLICTLVYPSVSSPKKKRKEKRPVKPQLKECHFCSGPFIGRWRWHDMCTHLIQRLSGIYITIQYWAPLQGSMRAWIEWITLDLTCLSIRFLRCVNVLLHNTICPDSVLPVGQINIHTIYFLNRFFSLNKNLFQRERGVIERIYSTKYTLW